MPIDPEFFEAAHAKMEPVPAPEMHRVGEIEPIADLMGELQVLRVQRRENAALARDQLRVEIGRLSRGWRRVRLIRRWTVMRAYLELERYCRDGL